MRKDRKGIPQAGGGSLGTNGEISQGGKENPGGGELDKLLEGPLGAVN